MYYNYSVIFYRICFEMRLHLILSLKGISIMHLLSGYCSGACHVLTQ